METRVIALTESDMLVLDKAKSITGYMNDDELEWLASAARNARAILEFGCYQGRSTRALADNTNGVVFAVDPWGLPYYNDDGSQAKWLDVENAHKYFKDNMNDLIKIGRVVPIQDYSWAFHSAFKFDLIFIDGDHRYDQVRDDIHLALRYVRRNGIISGHDYGHPTWPGVKKAVDEIFPNVKIVNTIWYVEIK
jgi:predicted O-methyltransferase YrrM